MIRRTSLALASTEKGNAGGFNEFKVFSSSSLFDSLLKTFLFVLSIELESFIFVEGFQSTRTAKTKVLQLRFTINKYIGFMNLLHSQVFLQNFQNKHLVHSAKVCIHTTIITFSMNWVLPPLQGQVYSLKPKMIFRIWNDSIPDSCFLWLVKLPALFMITYLSK